MNELHRPVSETALDKEMWDKIFPFFSLAYPAHHPWSSPRSCLPGIKSSLGQVSVVE